MNTYNLVSSSEVLSRGDVPPKLYTVEAERGINRYVNSVEITTWFTGLNYKLRRWTLSHILPGVEPIHRPSPFHAPLFNSIPVLLQHLRNAHAWTRNSAGNSFRNLKSEMSTLFSYFTKVPKKANNKSPICGSTAEDKKSTIPKEQANGFTPIKAENARKSSLDRRGTQPHVQTEAEPAGISLFDIVWAQLEGHPWWPSIICNHPTRRIHLKKNECHVQFFGDPPSRAWVKTK